MGSLLSFMPQLRPGQIVAFTGLPGTGKTGLMSLFASVCAAAGWRVVSNYTLECASGRLSRISDLQQSSTLLCIDELQLVAGSRDFAKGVNKTISEWIELDIRKPQNMLFYTTQDFDMVDINVRRLTSYIYDCSYVTTPRVSKVDRIKNIRYGRAVYNGAITIEHSMFYGLYDTYDRNVRLSSV